MTHRRQFAAALAVATLTLAASATPGPADAAPKAQTRWIVRYSDAASAQRHGRGLRAAGHRIGRQYSRVIQGSTVTLDATAAAQLRRQPGVLQVVPDALLHADASYPQGVQANPPIGLDRIDQHLSGPTRSYTSTVTGKGVTIYLVDSGLNLSHGDFAGRVVKGPNFADSSSDAQAAATAPTDCNGHGTHVAGIAAGTRYGVAKQATVEPIKVLNCQGDGYVSDTLAALDWVAAHHTVGKPAVANLSLGGARDATVDAAVQKLVASGVSVVVAGGNDAADACQHSPAAAPAALTVANATVGNLQATSSNHGSCIDLYAPGTRITSDFTGSSTATATLSGTSMASPHVAGAAALVLQARPSWTPAQVAAEITGKATRNAITNATAGTPNRMLYTLGGVTPGALEKVGTPTIAGAATVGRTLTGSAGAWGNGAVTLRWQWYRVSSTGVRTAISGATTASHAVVAADRGSRLSLTVTASKADYASRAASSGSTAVVS